MANPLLYLALLVSCPDMNGHFVHKQFLATADLFVQQTACESMHIHIDAHIAGQDYSEDFNSPLDGVTRPVPSNNPNEKDTVSAKFDGETVVFVVDRYVTSNGSVTHSTNMVRGTLQDADHLETQLSDVDSNGLPYNTKDYEFTRVANGNG